MYRSHVLVCGGTGCTSSGSQQIMEALKEEIKKAGLENEVSVVQTGCHGLCALGPIMIVYPDASFYSMVKVEDIPEIVQEHLLKGRVVTRLLYQETVTPAGVKALIDTDFYKKQHRIALRNCGIINPEVIEEYIGTGGYAALGKVLTEMTPDDVIQCLLDSGLRGRGGGGFPTVSNGSWPSKMTLIRSMSAVTPMRVIRAHLWIVPFWKEILTLYWKPWLLPVTLSEQIRVIFMFVPSTPLPLSV